MSGYDSLINAKFDENTPHMNEAIWKLWVDEQTEPIARCRKLIKALWEAGKLSLTIHHLP